MANEHGTGNLIFSAAQDSQHHPTRRASVRRHNRCSDKQKKEPQRGMGVEKLEQQLREQERLDFEINPTLLLGDPITITSSSSSTAHFPRSCAPVIVQMGLNHNHNHNHGYVGFHQQMGIGVFSSEMGRNMKKKKGNNGLSEVKEVVAIHRKEGSSSVMEYEFFSTEKK